MTPMEIVLSNRAKVCSSQPVEKLRVAGVSFEGRQAAVSQLQPQQGIAFQREPNNPYDPQAVAISTLDAIPLGYVPKDRTQAFIHSICFGKVYSVGQAQEGGLWGCSVDMQPRTPPVVVLSLPANLQGRCHVTRLLAGSQWDTVRNETLRRTNWRCNISGAPTSRVAERWALDEECRVLKLVGFAAEAPEVTRIADMLETGEDLSRELQIMNEWTDQDVARYLKHAVELAQKRGQRGEWRLDLGVLGEMGLQVPEELGSLVGG